MVRGRVRYNQKIMKPAPISADALAKRLGSLGFSAPGHVLDGLALYLALLMKWNRAMNLVGARTWEETLDTLVIDSFHLAAFIPGTGIPKSPSTLDLGAGAGLPGIPLRLLWQAGKYTLIEAREKRALFMKTALASCDAGNTIVFHGRAEDYFSSCLAADCIISRAFMPWKDLLAFARNALAPQGRMLFLALRPMPENLPPGWKAEAETAYPVQGKERHLWSLVKENS